MSKAGKSEHSPHCLGQSRRLLSPTALYHVVVVVAADDSLSRLHLFLFSQCLPKPLTQQVYVFKVDEKHRESSSDSRPRREAWALVTTLTHAQEAESSANLKCFPQTNTCPAWQQPGDLS